MNALKRSNKTESPNAGKKSALAESAGYAATVCPYCKNEVDLEMCHCGEDRKNHNPYELGHNFVPAGCTCGYADQPHIDKVERLP